MAIALEPLYAEQVGQSTSLADVDAALNELTIAKARFAALSIKQRIVLVEACAAGVIDVADDWIAAACHAKGIAIDSPVAAEEISAGPMATLRYLRLLAQTLLAIHKRGWPEIPGGWPNVNAQPLQVQVMPCRGFFDRVLFRGFKGYVHMQPHVTADNLVEHIIPYYRHDRVALQTTGISLVLGAGNVSSIAPTDAFYKLFHEGQVVLLKMNPVNEYLGPIFERAFKSLIEPGFLRIIFGGGEVGGYATQHALVDDVHITGSLATHERIVWGDDATDRDRRKAANDPVLKKSITSELGNVTPWIVVPHRYTARQLAFQAENFAASVVNNASFNCIASKLLITHRDWPQREQFLNLIDAVFTATAPRLAYYPGAIQRYRRFARSSTQDDDKSHSDDKSRSDARTLPWQLVRNVDRQRDPQFFEEESFVCVTAETALDAASPAEFLDRAVDFANEQVWGTLGCTLIVHPAFRRQSDHEHRLQQAISRLRYGTVAINHWSALSYAIMSAPWGGYPSATLAEPKSGIGWVHNTLMLDGIEKTVFEGPLTVWPKPMWFPSHRTAHTLARKALSLYARPSVLKLPSLFWTALRG